VSDLRLAIVGFGKIATTRHLPAIAATSGVALVAIADPRTASADVPHFASLDALLRDGPAIDAVVLCTPPQVRTAQARLALAAGKHVMLEKPPGATVSEITPLIAAAKVAGKSLFATWHSRFAPAVEPARELLATRKIEAVTITWKEDVRVWHPGQTWIFEAGGFGVFDPGINALSILTRILPRPVFVNRVDGEKVVVDASKAEYPQLYHRFTELAPRSECDVDLAPLQLVADAFLLGRRRIVEAFEDQA
jgi:D-galactose 1-dehydrogenase